MEAVCQGAREERESTAGRRDDERSTTSPGAGGHTIGILPGERRAAANEYVDTAIAIDGGGGTLSELGYGHVFDRPIAGLGTHQIESLDEIEHVATPEAAVDYVERA